ncbi:MAG: hypothetical protein V3V05_05965 [Pontiella sp.]
MKQVNQRRIVPISVVTIVIFSLLGFFQLFVIAGGYELEASTVKKFAPWVYEPFLKLAGEHPDTRPEWAVDRGGVKEVKTSSAGTIAGFSPEEIPVTLNLDPVPVENVIIEATVPIKEPEIVNPTSVPAKEPKVKPEDIVPVG